MYRKNSKLTALEIALLHKAMQYKSATPPKFLKRSIAGSPILFGHKNVASAALTF
jgi:hypothetical protein